MDGAGQTDDVILGQLLVRMVELICLKRHNEAQIRELGRLWRHALAARVQPRILVECTLANGETMFLSFQSRAAFANYVKTMHPSLSEVSNEEAIEWYGKKFAVMEIKGGRVEMEF
jgi:hypothetical protein